MAKKNNRPPAPDFRQWMTRNLVWAVLAFAASAAWCAAGGPLMVCVVASIQWWITFQAWWRALDLTAVIAEERAKRGSQ